MSVAVVVPWRGGCPYREAAWAHIRPLYEARHPVVVGEMGPDEDWSKGTAVSRALDATDASTLIIADADCVPPLDAVDEALAAVEAGHSWAVPHRRLRRLAEESTAAVFAGEPLPPKPPMVKQYEGHECGGILVINRAVYLRNGGFDPRFLGWGGEDDSLRDVLYMLEGYPVRLDADLLHLFHPGGDGRKGKQSPESLQLRARYHDAFRKRDPRIMRALTEEAR